jgi:hypothetical protein
MTYKEPLPTCFRNFGMPDTIRKLIFGSCGFCPQSYPCTLKTDFSERPRCGYTVAEAIEND